MKRNERDREVQGASRPSSDTSEDDFIEKASAGAVDGSRIRTQNHKEWFQMIRLLVVEQWLGSKMRDGLSVLCRFPALVLILFLGVIWTYYMYKLGLQLSPDGIFYLKTAAYMHFDGNYNSIVTVWPPLYPFVIHLFMYITPSPAGAAALASGFFLTGSMTFFYLLLRDVLNRPFVELLLVVSVLSIAGIWQIFEYALSESAFLFFLMGHFYFVYRCEVTRLQRFFVAAAIFASAAAMSRYIGYGLIFCFGGYTLYVIGYQRGMVARLKSIAIGLATLVPSGLWMVRNYGIEGASHGLRDQTKRTVFDCLHHLVGNLDKNFNHFHLFLLAGAVAFFLFRANQYFSAKRNDTDPLFSLEIYLGSFAVIYGILLVYTTSAVLIDGISDRMTSPFLIFTFVFVATALRKIPGQISTENAVKILMGICGLVLVAGIVTNGKNMSKHFSDRSHYPKKQTDYTSFGFEKSDAAKEIATYMGRVFLKHETVVISGLRNQKTQRAYMAHGFLLRKFIWDNNRISNLSIHNRWTFNVNHSRNFLSQACNFDATFSYNNLKRTILYRDLPNITSRQAVVAAMKKLLEQADVKIGFLYESAPLPKTLIVEDMPEILNPSTPMDKMKVEQVVSKPGNAVYKFTIE